MSTIYRASGFVELGGMPAYYGYPAEPPVALLVTGEQLNNETGHSVEGGRFHPETGEIRGIAEFKRQDTYISGTGGRTGTAFDVITGTGTVTDDWKDPFHNTYGLLFPDNAPGTEYDVVTTDPFTEGIPHCEILLGRGFPGVSSDDADYKPAECYTYLTFGYGNTYQYRLAFRYSRPIALEFSKDGGDSWLLPVMARRLGSLESALKANSDFLRMKVFLDRTNEVLRVEIGNGEVLRYGLPRDLTGEMLREGYLRMQTKNGWATLNLWPARHQSITATVKARDFGRPVANIANALFAVNATGQTPSGQTTDATLTPDGNGLGMTITASVEDAGDGLGSVEPPVFSDFTAIIPAVWTQDVDGFPDFRTVSGFYKQRIERETFDPVNRLFRQSAQVTLSNADGSLNDLVGDLACRVYGSNGSGYYPRMTGIARNPVFSRFDPLRLYSMSVRDKLELLEKPIGQGIRLDRWCKFSAVRFVAELCGVHPSFTYRFPQYPYGPAGYDCPYPILGSGVGSSPKHEYDPTVPGIAILLEILQDMVEREPVSGRAIPYYLGFDALGDMRFEPIDPFDALPKWAYSDLDPSGQGQIIGRMDWRPTTDNLRTDIILQGLDVHTNEILHTRRQVSAQARRMRGTRVPLFDQSPRYFTTAQMEEAMDVMSVSASIPELTGAFRAPAQEHVHAGDVVWVTDYFHGINGLFVIEDLLTFSGMVDVTGMTAEAGEQVGYQDLLVRSIYNYF